MTADNAVRRPPRTVSFPPSPWTVRSVAGPSWHGTNPPLIRSSPRSRRYRVVAAVPSRIQLRRRRLIRIVAASPKTVSASSLTGEYARPVVRRRE